MLSSRGSSQPRDRTCVSISPALLAGGAKCNLVVARGRVLHLTEGLENVRVQYTAVRGGECSKKFKNRDQSGINFTGVSVAL